VKTGKRLRFLKPRFRDYIFESELLEGVVRAELSRDVGEFLLGDTGAMVRYWDIASERELPPRRNPYTKHSYRGLFHGTFNAIRRGGDLRTERSVLLITFVRLELQAFRHDKTVRGFVFSRDDLHLLTWSEDGTPVCGNRVAENRGARPTNCSNWSPQWFPLDELRPTPGVEAGEWQTRRTRPGEGRPQEIRTLTSLKENDHA